MAQKEREPRRIPTTADIIDRVLDKGIVIEYRAHISIGGIDTLVTVDGRYIAASLDTHLQYAESLRRAACERSGWLPLLNRR